MGEKQKVAAVEFNYCQTDIEGGKMCSTQCEHCKEYYAPLEWECSLVSVSEWLKEKYPTDILFSPSHMRVTQEYAIYFKQWHEDNPKPQEQK